MIKPFDISPDDYQKRQPFPYYYLDGALDVSYASTIQQEILSLPIDQFDRYDNPFEQKYTLRNKHQLPTKLDGLFTYLQSPEFVKRLSELVGQSLILDETRNFWGVHLYQSGDALDIHVDAGIHPVQKLKKQVTIGLYLSHQWQPEYGCQLELWQGDDASNPNPKIYSCIDTVAPVFNRLVIFTNTDDSWHGNPIPAQCPPEARRIFITLSYLSANTDFENTRPKAYFIKRPQDPENPEKDRLRLLRCDPLYFSSVYRFNSNTNADGNTKSK
jgi:hypothetical protein